MKYAKLIIISLLGAALATGCSSSEEYEISGEVSAAQSVSGPITVEFFEIDKDDSEAERVSVYEMTLDEVGSFTATIEVSEGSEIIASALVDSDGDGACSSGELWAETIVEPKDDGTVDPISLALQVDACPAD